MSLNYTDYSILLLEPHPPQLDTTENRLGPSFEEMIENVQVSINVTKCVHVHVVILTHVILKVHGINFCLFVNDRTLVSEKMLQIF